MEARARASDGSWRAAVAVALELDVKTDTVREGLATFTGVDRRFQMRGKERVGDLIDWWRKDQDKQAHRKTESHRLRC